VGWLEWIKYPEVYLGFESRQGIRLSGFYMHCKAVLVSLIRIGIARRYSSEINVEKNFFLNNANSQTRLDPTRLDPTLLRTVI
jgi:hypothetical protein